MKKRLLAALLTLALVCALVPTASADLGFIIRDGVLVYYAGSDGDVVIPDTVTAIGAEAFGARDGVTSVTIPDSVTSIGDRAFIDCRGLTSITIPASVTSMNGSVFSRCTNLTDIHAAPESAWYMSQDGVLFNKDQTELVAYPKKRSSVYAVPNSVTRIGDYAFYDCVELTGVTIPEGVTIIGDTAFGNCGALTAAVMPEGLTDLGEYAFVNTGLTSAAIPGGVSNIGRSVFLGCEDLASVTICEGVTGISDSMFQSCSNLSCVTLPSSVTSIGTYAFEHCAALARVAIPEKVTSIGQQAFYDCGGLTDVTIPANATSIGTLAFSNCVSLTDIFVAEENPQYASKDGALFNKDVTKLVAYPAGKTGAYTVPAGVTGIESDAFFGCVGLTSLTIPSDVTRIGAFAFSHCDNLTVYGYPGSEAERYCRESEVSFRSLDTTPGTAQAGGLKSGSGDRVWWEMTREGELTLTVTDGELAPEEAILVACYDTSGRFTGVKWVTAQSPATQIDPDTPNVRLFWLGAEGTPQSSSATVWGK